MCNFRAAIAVGNRAKTAGLSRIANRTLDKAVTEGVIHVDQAANHESAISFTVNILD